MKTLCQPLIKNRCARVGCALLIGLLCFSLGIFQLLRQAERVVRQQVHVDLSLATYVFDKTIANAEFAAESAAPLLGAECSRALPILRNLVATVPDVRTINLVTDGQQMCSSLYEGGDTALATGTNNTVEVTSAQFTEHTLQLLPVNSGIPNASVLGYRHRLTEGEVLIGISIYYIENILRYTSSRDILMSFEVGGQWLTESGEITRGVAVQASDTLASEKYEYKVNAYIPDNYILGYALGNYRLSAFWYLVVSAVFSFLAYWRLSQSTSPVAELRRGLEKREFVPFLQPIFSPQGTLIGGEVLARWNHPELGAIRPDNFIPLAEETGLVKPMTLQLMDQVERDFLGLGELLPSGFHIGFNICAAHCEDMSFVRRCERFLSTFAERQIELVIELTERSVIQDEKQAKLFFQALSDCDVKIAVDDFGTGYSSLTTLKNYHVDFLKVDKSFVSLIGSNAITRHIVENVLDLALRMNLKVVAEGVETQEQADYLSRKGVDYLQGFLLGTPVSIDEFIRRYILSQDTETASTQTAQIQTRFNYAEQKRRPASTNSYS